VQSLGGVAGSFDYGLRLLDHKSGIESPGRFQCAIVMPRCSVGCILCR